MKRWRERTFRGCKLATLGAVLLLAGLAGSASAQGSKAIVLVEGPAPDVVLKEGGDSFQVTVSASGVTNLAGFQFSLTYDSKVLKFVSLKQGDWLGTTGREVMCPDPFINEGKDSGMVRFNCVTLGPPVSSGGTAGPSGSGVLTEMVFSPVGGGTSPLDLTEGILLQAEIVPNNPSKPVQLESTTQSASLEVQGSSGGLPWLIIGAAGGGIIVIGGIVVVGLMLARRSRGGGMGSIG
jgi:hypothetical protein